MGAESSRHSIGSQGSREGDAAAASAAAGARGCYSSDTAIVQQQQGAADEPRSASADAGGTFQGLRQLLKRRGSKASDRPSAESTCSSVAGQHMHSTGPAQLRVSSSGGTLSSSSGHAGQGETSLAETPPASAQAAGADVSLQQQQQQTAPLLPPKPPSASPARTSHDSSKQQDSAKQKQQQQQQSGGPASSRQLSGSLSGKLSRNSSGGLDASVGPSPSGRGSFAYDSSLYAEQQARSTGQPPLPPNHPQQQYLSSSLLQQNAARHGSSGSGAGGPDSGSGSASRVRASIESCISKASTTQSGGPGRGSNRSSFAAEVDQSGGDAETDAYGRPSFAAFEDTLRGRGAVFEASLPADLAGMYRRLAVLLPQAPVPLLTILQLWGITDPEEARETVQIFVMQGVLKVATLPDGASWIMPSPEHQQFVKAAHADSVRDWHEAVLDIYRRQVIAQRHMQQQQLLAMGDPAGAVMISNEVQPNEFVNDGYIWLALTHHLLGAGRLLEVRALLIDPAWLEVKLHCYGVAVVVDDFRAYLQVGSDPMVKAVLQAFQMSLSCCMERTHIPMMRNQLVLRLMAAAQAAAAAASASTDGALSPSASSNALPRDGQPGASTGRSSSDSFLAAALAMAGSGSGAAATAAGGHNPRLSITSTGSATGSAASFARQEAEYAAEMKAWFEKQYAASCTGSGLLWPPLLQQPSMQPPLPPHLMGYSPSLRQAGGRHRMALRGHLGPIRSVLITPDGKDVLTASDDGGVQVWDMDIGDCILQLRPPDQPTVPAAAGALSSPLAAAAPQPLTCLAVTPDGSCCLSGDQEGWLTCWNLKTGTMLQRVRAHMGRMNALALDRSGSRCITGGQDRAARVWSLPVATPGLAQAPGIGARSAAANRMGGLQGSPLDASGQGVVGSVALEMEMTGHGLSNLDTGAVLDVCLSSDSVLGASASDDFSIRVWDLDHQSCLATCKGHSGWVVSVTFVGSSHTLVSASQDGTGRVWDAWSGDCLAVLNGHTGRLNRVVASKDGRVIVTCSDDNTARVWSGGDFSLISVLEGHTSWINDVALTHNGSRAVTVSGDGTSRVWDPHSGTCLDVLQGHSEDVITVVLTSKGRFAVTGSLDGTAQVWDLAAQDAANADVHDGKVIGLVARADGSHAASIGTDGCLRLWDIRTGKCSSNKVGHVTAIPQQLQLTADGSRAYSCSGARKLIRWDMDTGEPTLCLQQKQGSRTKCMGVSADGRKAVVLLFDSSMTVYDTDTGEPCCELMRKGERDALRVHSGGVNGVLMTADGSKAISWSKDATARVWDTTTGACTLILQGHEDSVTTAVLSPDESLLATASYDKSVRLWALGPNCSGSGLCLKVLQHADPVAHVAFSGSCHTMSPAGTVAAAVAGSSDVSQPLSPATAAMAAQQQLLGLPALAAAGGASGGASAAAAPQRLVTACDGHALWLWDVQTGACIAALGEHKDRVTAVTFSPDGRWLASASQDRSVMLWDAAAGHLVGLYVGDAAMVCCCFAWRGRQQQLQDQPQLIKGRMQVQLADQRKQQHQPVTAEQADGPPPPPGSAAELALWPSPGGLTLLAGDTTGSVHFITCW